jgi:hypothetical protein
VCSSEIKWQASEKDDQDQASAMAEDSNMVI